jgi:hypothetical protein
MADNVVPLHTDNPEDPRDVLDDLLGQEWIRLIRDLASGKDAVEGAGGSSKSMTTAERVRILSSASDYLLKLQKSKPSRTRSGIADLAAQHREPSGRTRRR